MSFCNTCRIVFQKGIIKKKHALLCICCQGERIPEEESHNQDGSVSSANQSGPSLTAGTFSKTSPAHC